MELTTEIKKYLYKQKPFATLIGNCEEYYYYECDKTFYGQKVKFKIPLHEGKDFGMVMPAQLLIRWLNIQH